MNVVAPPSDLVAPAPLALSGIAPKLDHSPVNVPTQIPASRRLQYAVSGQAKGFPYSAKAELVWQHDRASYSARLEISSFLGSRVQTSTGEITPEGLAPTRFSDKLRSEVAAHFERDKGKVSFSANTPDVALQAGAQDRLSVLLQLASLLAGAPQRYPIGTAIAIQTIGPRDAEDWHFVVGAEEALNLPDATAPLPAAKLKREVRRDFEVGVELWLAPSLAYLPVQLRLTQSNGDVVQLQLKLAQTP